MDQHHTGLRLVDSSCMGTHTGSASYWVDEVDNSSMGTHNGSASHWVEAC